MSKKPPEIAIILPKRVLDELKKMVEEYLKQPPEETQ